ncbi:unnamed protein product [Mytilus coruscus]|uniref:SWIM-type domain-containing protein n=1 Tax=Mytilus coruscus TaxID=42192 RepID=A0A6J8BU06_MYTCO|nr:unnamed protein product [Mytilus coruscus]
MDNTDNNAFEEFSSNTIGKLKDFSSAKGLSCMRNKQQLVSRCFVAWESNIPLRYSEQEQLSKLKTEYDNRSKEANIDDPRSLKDDDWSSDVKEWPKIDLGKIFSFILSKKEQDMDFIGHYKTQKAYSYYQSCFVDTVFCATLNGSQIIKSHVTSSQSVRNEPHDVWLAVNNENEIQVSWCSCIAGLAQTCNHVIAVFYKIEFATNMGYNDPSCTSVPCGWNTSTKKNVQPCRLSDLNLRRDNRSKISGSTMDNAEINLQFKLKYDLRREDHKSVSDGQVEGLYSSLHRAETNCPKSMLNAGEIFAKNSTDASSFINSLTLTDDQSILIAKKKKTQGQSSNKFWLEQRKGRLTASILHEVSKKMNEIVKNKITKTTPLVAKVLGKTFNIDHVPAIKYGRAHENTARNLFLALESPKHRDFKVDHCGLFVKAVSPDGIVSCLCCTKQVLEIKCPFSLANKSVVDGWKNLDYLRMNESTQRLELNQSHSYYTQMQAQMAVTGLKMGHFLYSLLRDHSKTKFSLILYTG